MDDESDSEKYSEDPESNIRNISTRTDHLSVDSVPATIKSIMLSEVTESDITDMETASTDVQHPPTAEVVFQTDVTDVSREYRLDPFITPLLMDEKDEFLGTVLSTAGVTWDTLPNVIGNEIYLKRDTDEEEFRIHKPMSPADYSVLSETQPQFLYLSDIDSQLIDLVVVQAKNQQSGYAQVMDIETKRTAAIVTFSLPHGGKFDQRFTLYMQDESKDTLKDRVASGIWGSDRQPYTFWNLCRDTLGYIPTESEYEKLIDSQVEIVYTAKGWHVSDSISDLLY